MELRIDGMSCGGCAKSVTKVIQLLDPDARVEADPPTRTVIIETTATRLAIQQALVEAGYPVTTT